MKTGHQTDARGLVVFDLPRGLDDGSSARHRRGLLRPSTLRDEVKALSDFRAHLRPESFPCVLLGRVVVKLGSLERVDFGVIQALPDEDRDFLVRLYEEVNGYDRA